MISTHAILNNAIWIVNPQAFLNGFTCRGFCAQVTGQLGDVMHESSKIAYTLARNFLNTKVVGHRDNAFLATQQVHAS